MGLLRPLGGLGDVTSPRAYWAHLPGLVWCPANSCSLGRMDPRVRSGRRDRAQGITVAGICSLKQLTMKFSVGEETREAKIGWGIALCPSSLCESPCPTPSCFLGWQIPFPPLGSACLLLLLLLLQGQAQKPPLSTLATLLPPLAPSSGPRRANNQIF